MKLKCVTCGAIRESHKPQAVCIKCGSLMKKVRKEKVKERKNG